MEDDKPMITHFIHIIIFVQSWDDYSISQLIDLISLKYNNFFEEKCYQI